MYYMSKILGTMPSCVISFKVTKSNCMAWNDMQTGAENILKTTVTIPRLKIRWLWSNKLFTNNFKLPPSIPLISWKWECVTYAMRRTWKLHWRTSRVRFKIIRTAHESPFARSAGRKLNDERIMFKMLSIRSPDSSRWWFGSGSMQKVQGLDLRSSEHFLFSSIASYQMPLLALISEVRCSKDSDCHPTV